MLVAAVVLLLWGAGLFTVDRTKEFVYLTRSSVGTSPRMTGRRRQFSRPGCTSSGPGRCNRYARGLTAACNTSTFPERNC